jgi:hypothetical protein
VASPSSTSSSEPTAPLGVGARVRSGRLPWGLFSAVLLVLAFELGLRAMNPAGIVASATEDERQYRAVVPELLAFGAPDVAIVGSSRARRAVTAPIVKDAFTAEGQKVRVGNFALDSAKAEETQAVIRRLLEVTPNPRLIVWPIAPRDVSRDADPPRPFLRYLWRVSDWWRYRRTFGGSADRHLPDALRNETSRYSWLMRYRPYLRDLLEGSQRRPLLGTFVELVLGKRDPTPIHGAVDPHHLRPKGSRSMPIKTADVRRYIGRSFRERRWLVNHQSRSLEKSIGILKQAKIPLIFIELPTHPVLEKMQPSGTTKEFRTFMRGIAKRHAVTFVPLSQLDVELEPTDYYEHSHVNYVGARKFTQAITKEITTAFPKARQ